MALTLNGTTNTIGGLSVGGLPDGTVDTDTLAANAVVTGKITDGTIASGDLATGVGGKLLQFARVGTSATQDLGTTYTMTDLTDLSISFTPVSASSQLWITGHPYFRITGSTTYYGHCRLRILDGSDVVHEEAHAYRGYAQGGVATGIVAHTGLIPIFGYVTSTGSTSARTIKLQAHNENNSNSALVMGPYQGYGFMSIMEVAA